jgi:chromosome partitioning protein
MRMSLGASLRLVKPEAPVKSLKPGNRAAKVLAIAAQKGGVGKTTTSLSLGSAAARFFNKRVLIIDLDPQCHVNLAMRDQVHVGGGSLSDVLAEKGTLEVEEITTSTSVDNLFVTPPDPQLMTLEDRLSGRIGKEMALSKALEVTRTHYDLILIDCPPNIGTLTINALAAADQVLIPTTPTALGAAGVSGLIEATREVREHYNPTLETLGVLLTRVDGRNARTNDAVYQLMDDSWGELVLPVQIGVNDALSQAQLMGQDIYTYQPSSRSAEQYKDLAELAIERLG